MKRFARRLLQVCMLSASMFGLVGFSQLAYAAGGGGSPDCGHPCAPAITMVQKQIMVPTWTTERRVINVTRMVPEDRVRHYVVKRMVPEVRQVEKAFETMVPVKRHREVREVVQVPVYRNVEKHYVDYVPTYRDVREMVDVQVPRWENVKESVEVMVPHVERRVGTRAVCKMVQDVEIREVCRDVGHWENRRQKVSCGSGCGGCGKVHYEVCRVWVPNIVREQVEVPVMRPEMVRERFEYNVTVCRPEQRHTVRRVCHYETQQREVVRRVCDYRPVQRSRMVRVCELQPQERVRNVSYVEYVPQRVVRRVNETYCRYVEEPRTEHYTVCVPRIEQQEISVPVCRMVPKLVNVPVMCSECGDQGDRVPRRMRWLLSRAGC